MLDYLCDDCREAFEDLKSDLEAMDIALYGRSGDRKRPGLLYKDGI